MRSVAAALLVVALAGACRSRVPKERPSEVFGGVGLSALPNVGVTLIAGQLVSEAKDTFDSAFEMRATYQGGKDSERSAGKFVSGQVGVKHIGSPGHARHPVLRYGASWSRATGDPEILDAGDYFGFYAGFAYEWDLGPRLTFAPGVDLSYLLGEGGLGEKVLPQLTLAIIFRF